MSVDDRLRKLEMKPQNRNMPEAFAKIYEALKEMELRTTGVPNDAEFENMFVEKNGSKSDFVKIKMVQWNRQHGKGGINDSI